jgi:hypothetical protein
MYLIYSFILAEVAVLETEPIAPSDNNSKDLTSELRPLRVNSNIMGILFLRESCIRVSPYKTD